MAHDLKAAVRSLGRAPVLTAAAVLSLALGTGANTALFTLVDQIILRQLPVEKPEDLVQFRMNGGRFGSQTGDGTHTFAYTQYQKFRDRNEVFQGVTGLRVERATLVGPDRSELISATMVAGNYFDVLGVKAHAGRLLRNEDNLRKGAHPVVVLQYDFWRNRFGARPEIVGQEIRINGQPFTVIGIAARDFQGTDSGLPTNCWLPVMMKSTITPSWDALDDDRYAWFYIFARLKPGVSREQAQASMRVLYRQIQEEELKGAFFARFPDEKPRFFRQSFLLEDGSKGQSVLRERMEKPLVLLQALVVLVLLIACANVANLLIARATASHREVAIRMAMGAGQSQVARRFLLESLLLSIAGGLAGLAVGYWLTQSLIGLMPTDRNLISITATPDLRILGFSLGVSVLTAILFGVAPAWTATRVQPGAVLKSEAAGGVGGHGHMSVRKLLAGVQVALCALLLVGAGLFSRSLGNLRKVDLGFQTENIVMFGLRPATRYEDERKLVVYREVLQNLSATPGVKAAGANSTRLLTGGRWDGGLTLPTAPAKLADQPYSFYNAVTPGYFEALGMKVMQGRDFTWSDWGSPQRRALVNVELAQKHFGSATPIGHKLGQGRGSQPDTEIIGVFSNAHYHEVRGAVPPQTFVSMGSAQYLTNANAVNVYVRTAGDPRTVIPQIREVVRRTDANLVVSELRLMDEQLDMRLINERLLAFLSSGFSIIAIILAVVGLYGVLAFSVERRTREIGIRMALGAAAGSVVRLVVSEVLLVVSLALLVGLAGAWALTKPMETLLFGLEGRDPSVFALSAAVLLLAAAASAWLPARRAAKLDPMDALRHD
ncbi:MAG: ABC transporter permease [Acidobacteria bacterium]|nr:ABC transporter permease [Acidobacteriota bacterium]